MTLQSHEINGIPIAVVQSETVVLTDGQAALDALATIHYETGASRIVMHKEAVADDFFTLSTGLAGEILQKFINYRSKLAIVGDFSRYTSKSLQDFIYECNTGRDFFFVSSEAEALERLSSV